MDHRVPFLDLHSQLEPVRSEIFEALRDAIDASDFVLGPRLESFEEAFADYCGTRHAVGVSSGTDALYLILKALGIGPGDEVITVPNVFIAAVEVIAQTGARPVLVDVLEDSFCIDPEAVRRALTDRTRAIIPVHLFGQPCEMDELKRIAEEKSLYVIEDACQAHGATYKGHRAGSLGHAAAFSFYPTKNLGGFGDGGAVTTDDDDIASKVRMLRHHAQRERNRHDEVGFNCRLDSIQAAVLEVKLRYLDDNNRIRRDLASRYRARLAGTDYKWQVSPENVESVYHIVAVRHPRRGHVLEQLDQAGVGYGHHIAMPIHMQPGYAFLGYKEGAFPVSERLCNELISLPIYPTLAPTDVDYVTEALAKVGVSV